MTDRQENQRYNVQVELECVEDWVWARYADYVKQIDDVIEGFKGIEAELSITANMLEKLRNKIEDVIGFLSDVKELYECLSLKGEGLGEEWENTKAVLCSRLEWIKSSWIRLKRLLNKGQQYDGWEAIVRDFKYDVVGLHETFSDIVSSLKEFKKWVESLSSEARQGHSEKNS